MTFDKKKYWQRTYLFLILWGIVAIGFSIELLIESYPEFPKNLNLWLIVLLVCPPIWLVVNLAAEYFLGKRIANGFKRIGEKKIRTINKVLAGIIFVPIVVLLMIAVFMTIFKK